MDTGVGVNERRVGLQPMLAFQLHLFQFVKRSRGTDWSAVHWRVATSVRPVALLANRVAETSSVLQSSTLACESA